MTAWPNSARNPSTDLSRRFRGSPFPREASEKRSATKATNKVQKAQKMHHPHSKIAAAWIKGRRRLCHPSCHDLRRPRATAGRSKGRTVSLQVCRFILPLLILQAS
jgi:hypothetical protein